MPHRCAILDDYQNVATKLADWSIPDVEVKVFNDWFADQKAAVAALQGFSIICMMRERTPFLKATLEQLPDLKLLMTSGARNASIDLDYAAERGITVSGTGAAGQPTAELAIGIMLELARKIGYENNRMKQGVPWQSTLGIELGGKTLGLLGARKIAGAGLDTFDIEPLPINHPLRKLDNVVLTPHLGYVSQEGYKIYYTDMVDNIKAWLAGSPKRVIKK